MEISFCDTLNWIPVFYPQGALWRQSQALYKPILCWIIKLVSIIYWRYYISFSFKNTLNNTGEKHIINFMGLPVVLVNFFCNFRKKGSRPKWTIYKHESEKNKKCLRVGNFGILSVVLVTLFYYERPKITWPKLQRAEKLIIMLKNS